TLASSSFISSHLRLLFFFQCSRTHQHLHSFPTRRSSDLDAAKLRDPQKSPKSRWGRAARPPGHFARKEMRTGPETAAANCAPKRSEEHTSELQSHLNLVCRLLLEKKKPVHHNRPNRNRAD